MEVFESFPVNENDHPKWVNFLSSFFTDSMQDTVRLNTG